MIKLQEILEGTCGYGVDGQLGDEPAGPHLLRKKKSKDLEESTTCLCEACWKGYTKKGMKTMFGKKGWWTSSLWYKWRKTWIC